LAVFASGDNIFILTLFGKNGVITRSLNDDDRIHLKYKRVARILKSRAVLLLKLVAGRCKDVEKMKLKQLEGYLGGLQQFSNPKVRE
jgi:hypothetical protein